MLSYLWKESRGILVFCKFSVTSLIISILVLFFVHRGAENRTPVGFNVASVSSIAEKLTTSPLYSNSVSTAAQHRATNVNNFTKAASTRSASLAINAEQYYRRRDSKVNEFNCHVILGPSRQPVCFNDTFMIILVHSHPSYTDKRQAIRQTWGRPVQAPDNVRWPGQPNCCSRLRLFFVIGQDERYDTAVRNEQSKYDDILQGNFVDSYRNMTLKSLLGLKIVTEMCPKARYLLKSDDDMFINLPLWLNRLEQLQLKKAIMGPLIPRPAVKRSGKWALTTEEFSFPYFPPYMSGSAYVITNDVISELLVTSDYVPHIFIDDVYVTGILGRILKITHVGGRTQREFAFAQSKPARACAIAKKRVITATGMTPTKLRDVWQQLSTVKLKKLKRHC